ncbi:ABC transporter ATP-binding protein [Oceanobacillus profundus]|uniref:ABC transporter ATP-binding protein n=1 Tax=Oceanobacillus profundus TaxID=372463 RepID=A0A417YIU4_9BACI|nr:ABC transporter ATP-binding protein [Oceanobacillus profundus]RHW32978.1 ABC transporter ATP-binding protein [Oceanobacillus profundus]
MLKVQSITKSYGKKLILNQISFSVQPGEIIGLVGENGAGKSTLLNILATLASPTNGNIVLYEKSYREKRKEVRKQIGYVPQDIAIWEEFSVEENMVFFEKLSWKRRSKQELQQLCLDMELDKWKEPVKTLSGGMKRKLNMAISLIHEPDLLLLDEPTVGIDLKSRKEIGNHLKNLAIKENKMIMYTSHDMDEISTLCDSIICIGEDPFYKNLLKEANKQIVTF